MDEIERRLRKDASDIRAQVPPQLKARIASSLCAAKAPPPRRRDFGWRLWAAASLSGATAAVVAILAVNRGGVESPEPPPGNAVVQSVPQYIREFEELPLRAKTADLTAPLEEELKNLRSDLERARENVEQDLEFTF
jgi:hypothetical protein